MKRLLIFIIVMIVGSIAAFSHRVASAPYEYTFSQNTTNISHDSHARLDKNNSKIEFAPGEIIVKFKGDIQSNIPENIPQIAALNRRYGVISSDRIFKSEKTLRTKLSNVYRIKVPDDADIHAVISDYMKSSDVEYAQPNYIYRIMAVPNDPYYPKQWAHQKIQSEKAWGIERGNESIVIAIIDTGVAWNHPDLAANIWNNSDEIANNSIDDDNNGYVDDVRGWNFAYNRSDPMDDDGHGTNVAGIAAAITNNSLGVAGICWHCKIMPIKSFNYYGYMTDVNAALSIKYAVDNNASIISMSWGGYGNSSLQKDALDYAYSKGIVLVAAAGNENSYLSSYPESYENVISVAATNSNDEKTGFSNYGYQIDVAAPGESIYSTYLDMYGGGEYSSFSGTSAATPFVAGLAGLILSRNHSFSQEDVRKILKSSADPVISPAYIGAGRIDAYKALQISYIPEAKLLSPINEQALRGIINISGSTDAVLNNYTIEYGSGFYPKNWTLLNFSIFSVDNGTLAVWDTSSMVDGEYTVRLIVNADNGWNEDKVFVIVANNDNACYSCGDCNYKLSKDGANVSLAANITSCNCINIGSNNTRFDCNGNVIKGCGISYVDVDNSNNGFRVSGKSNVLVRNCNLTMLDFGVYVSNSRDIIIENNSADYNYEAVYIGNSFGIIVNHNNFERNNPHAIELYKTYNSTIRDNTIWINRDPHDEGLDGIYSDDSDFITIRNNKIESDPHPPNVCIRDGSGMVLVDSNFNIVENNSAKGCYAGIELVRSFNNSVTNNYATLNGRGVWVLASSYNNLTRNNLSGNNGWGLEIEGGTIGIGEIGEKKDYDNFIDTSNLINGYPIHYLFDVQNIILENFTAGLIEIPFSKNITLRNITVKNGDGIVLISTNNSRIYGNNLSNVQVGVYLFFSQNDTVENNYIFNAYKGVSIVGKTFHPLKGYNIIQRNYISGWMSGIDLTNTVNNSFYSNDISGGGIDLDEANYNIFKANNIFNGGVWMELFTFEKNNNIFEYNNFYNNKPYNIEYARGDKNITAVNNWWGTTNETEISRKIYDCNDDVSKGCVIFKPYLMQRFGLPIISLIECQENSSIWEKCSDIAYGDYLTAVRINCSSIRRNITSANVRFVNSEDNYTFFNADIVDYDGYFTYDNSDLKINDSGNFLLYTSCTDNESAQGGDKYAWFIPFGNLETYLINTVNTTVERYNSFNFSSGVHCIGGECGNVFAALSFGKPVLFFDDMENGVNGWTTEYDQWQLGIPTSGPNSSYSGLNVWATNPFGNYNNRANYWLMSPNISLRSATAPILSFKHWYEIEPYYDSGVVQIFNGTVWKQIYPIGGYPSNNTFYWPDGAYTGNSYGWKEALFDLANYSGLKSINILLNFMSDSWNNYAGWYIDDVKVDERTFPVNNETPLNTVDQNPVYPSNLSCLQNMKNGDSCNQTWNVVATGDYGNYTIFASYLPLEYLSYVLPNTTSLVNISIMPSNHPPVIISHTPSSLTLKLREGYSLQFNHTSYDMDNDTLTYSWFLDSVKKASTPSWLFLPTTAECGSHNVMIYVNDTYRANASLMWNASIWLSGDVIDDHIVNIFDLAAVGLCFGKPANGNCKKADINPPPKPDGTPEGNGVIDIFDLATVGLNFGKSC